MLRHNIVSLQGMQPAVAFLSLQVVLVQNLPAPLPSILRLQEKAAGEVMTQLYMQLAAFIRQGAILSAEKQAHLDTAC